MVKDADLEAGLPAVLLLLGELVSSGGSSRSARLKSSVRIPTAEGELFLQAFRTFCLLIASTEFFLRTRVLTPVLSVLLLEA